MSGKFPLRGETNLAVIVQSVRDLFQGRSNAEGEFTVTENTTTTVVAAINCGPSSRVVLIPRTANAAAGLTATYIPEATTIEGQFTVHHANNAQTDRTYGYAIRG
jgi:hypothetical protein